MIRTLCLLVFLACSFFSLHAAPSSEEVQFFETRIRPVLADKCYSCHSVNAKKLKADLLLDHRQYLLEGGDSGPSLVPGEVAESLLIEAISYKNIDLQMPPKSKLSDQQIADLNKWVEMGAPWPEEALPTGKTAKTVFDWETRKSAHWCWQSIKKYTPPQAGVGWARGAVDQFVAKELKEAGINPAVEADKRTWIRRVYFSLIGLPPTIEQVQAFLADEGGGAFERVVDGLLASPHYGERWGRHWLDLARYAESLGHEFDYTLNEAYQYRDYVIRALNDDVPYDQFMTEQVAGDLMASPRMNKAEGYNESIIGTGFWFLHEAVHAPTDVLQDEADRVDNQVDVFSKTFLGLTIACARCHDHKFDAIPTKDFYAISGFLQSSRMNYTTLDRHGKIASALPVFERLQKEHRVFAKSAEARTLIEQYLLAAHKVTTEQKGDDKEKKAFSAAVAKEKALDGSLLERYVKAMGSRETHRVSHPLHSWKNISEKPEQVEKFATGIASLPTSVTEAAGETFSGEGFGDCVVSGQAFGDGPVDGVADSGRYNRKLRGVLQTPTFVLGDRVHFRVRSEACNVRLIVDGYQMATRNGLLFGGTKLAPLNTGGAWEWRNLGGGDGKYKGHRAYLEFADDGDGYIAVDQIVYEGGVPKDSVHPINRSVSAALPKDIPGLARAYSQDAEIAAFFTLGLVPPPSTDWEERRVTAEKAASAAMNVLSIMDGTGENQAVMIRGNPHSLGDEAPRQLPVAIFGEQEKKLLPEDGSGRLLLAEQLCDPANPFPSRVMVNRVWHHLFGRGLVPTVDDFGVMGQPPSHPELLDWLAQDFVEEKKWSVKALIKDLVLSSTYRQSSRPVDADPDALAADPTNILLHRMPVRRLESEPIRDAVYAVSGRLDPKMYGPSVPVHLNRYQGGRGKPKAGPLDGEGRRSIYLAVRRNFMSSMMLTFDFPTPFNSIGRRTVSNVPAQALTMMNDPAIVGEAKRWAEAIVAETAEPDDRIRMAYEQAFSRLPSDEQLTQIRGFLHSQAELHNTDLNNPKVWADVCHVLFNMKEFIYIN